MYKSLGEGLSSLAKTEGYGGKGLALGWFPTLVGYSAQGFGKFGFYEIFKDVYKGIVGKIYYLESFDMIPILLHFHQVRRTPLNIRESVGLSLLVLLKSLQTAYFALSKLSRLECKLLSQVLSPLPSSLLTIK